MKISTLIYSIRICLLGLLGISSVATAQEKGLLYKIEKQGIQPSYLFGTIHLMPNNEFEIKESVEKAFKASDLIVLEIDMDDPNLATNMMQHMMMDGDSTLEQYFSDTDYQKLDEELQTHAGMGVAMINKMKPLMVMSMLVKKYVGAQPASYELSFVKLSEENKKEILGLETVADQMAVFDEIPYQAQADDISQMLNDEKRYTTLFKEMIKLYKAEDVEALYNIFTDYYGDQGQVLDLVLHDRNRKWIPKIGEYAKEQSVFFGVGAGHLGGEEGVLNLLEEAGYTVTPVP
ncbi:MAG: TraB/GumN family protein [Bacteroidota bacterium]